MNSKLRRNLKKIPFAVSLIYLLRNGSEFLAARIRKVFRRRSFDRNHFESVFLKKVDPWNYESPHQQERLSLLLQEVTQKGGLILEAGCAEGMFTYSLAKQGTSILAVDMSGVAIQRAKKRCESLQNVCFVQADLLFPPFLVKFDVIICAGVLGYFPEQRLFIEVARKTQELIQNQGYLILENRWQTNDGSRSGKTIHEYFQSSSELRLANLVRRDEYGISIFQRAK